MALNLHPEQLLEAILETSDEAFVAIAPDGTIQNWSRGAERLYGYAATEVAGRSLALLSPQGNLAALQDFLGAARCGLIPSLGTVERLHKDGAVLMLTVKHSVLRNDWGAVVGFVERGRPLERRAGSGTAETHLRFLLEQLPLVLWTTDRNMRVTASWGSGVPVLELGPGELVSQTFFGYLESADAGTTPMAHHYSALRSESVHFECQKRSRILDVRLGPLRGGSREIIGSVGLALDITERRRNEEQIRYQATHDGLTGLANYREFMDSLEREVRRGERSHRSFAVLLLDVDDLKRINDRLGHLAGNRALRRLADVIKEHCRATDLAARYGGDEFAVLLIDSDLRMADHVAERIETCLRGSMEEPSLSVSIGIGICPDDGRTAQDLLEAADQHLYKRKKASQAAT